MRICSHERCESCHHIVVPVTRETKLSVAVFCPDCGATIREVAKPLSAVLVRN